MNNTTISDVNELANKSPINTMTVTVKKAFEPTEGEGQYGPWRMQAAIVKDDTGEIRATFWDRFNMDLRNFEGEEVTITSGRDGKDRFSGITTDDYNNKRQLRISKEAKFTSPDGELPEDETDMSGSSVANNGAPASEYNSKRFVTEETKRASIEKQVALRESVAYAATREDVNATPKQVIECAEMFYQFLHGEPEVI